MKSRSILMILRPQVSRMKKKKEGRQHEIHYVYETFAFYYFDASVN